MEPVVVSRIKLNTIYCKIDFELKNNVTLLIGDSGAGKTMTFKLIEQSIGLDKPNYKFIYGNRPFKGLSNYKMDRKTGNLFFIDNADSILNMDSREEIALDRLNQYIIITHAVDGYAAGPRSIAKLVLENNTFKLKYFMMNKR